MIAGLRRELVNSPERAKDIKAEIKHWEGQARPSDRTPDQQEVADPVRVYLAALKDELVRAGDDKARVREIRAEIALSERAVKANADPDPVKSEPVAVEPGPAPDPVTERGVDHSEPEPELEPAAEVPAA
jgi:hypothetical protein